MLSPTTDPELEHFSASFFRMKRQLEGAVARTKAKGCDGRWRRSGHVSVHRLEDPLLAIGHPRRLHRVHGARARGVRDGQRRCPPSRSASSCTSSGSPPPPCLYPIAAFLDGSTISMLCMSKSVRVPRRGSGTATERCRRFLQYRWARNDVTRVSCLFPYRSFGSAHFHTLSR